MGFDMFHYFERQDLKLKAGCVTALLFSAFASALSGDVNPDWAGYELIFDSAGAWLNDSNRDPIFLALMAFFREISPIDTYEAFRLVVGIIFTGMIFLLCSGICFRVGKDRLLIVVCTVLTVCSVRFTVQIREGLAVLFFLIAMSFLYRKTIAIERSPGRTRVIDRNAVWSVLFMVASAGTHISGFILLLMYFVAFSFSIMNSDLRRFALSASWVLLLLLFLPFAFQASFVDGVSTYATDLTGDREILEQQQGAGMVIYWLSNAILCGYIFKRVDIAFRSIVQSQFTILFYLIAGPLAIVSLITIIGLKFSLSAPFAIVLFVRIFDLSVGLSMIFLSFFSRDRGGLVIASAFIIVKYARDLILW